MPLDFTIHRPALPATASKGGIKALESASAKDPGLLSLFDVSQASVDRIASAIESRIETRKKKRIPRNEGLLCALLASTKYQMQCPPISDVANEDMHKLVAPPPLPKYIVQAAKLLQGTPTVKGLRHFGQQFFPYVPGLLYKALYAYLDRKSAETYTDEQAAAMFYALGSRHAPEGSWQQELKEAFSSLRRQPSFEALGLVLVLVERGIAELEGREVSTMTVAMAAAAAEKEAHEVARDTAVYSASEKDLTVEMMKTAANAEMDQYEKYEVFEGDWVTWWEIPKEIRERKDFKPLSAKLFFKPKIKDGKLIAKARMTPRGYEDENRYKYRNDSPTASRTSFYTYLSVALSKGHELMKVDITGAFLQGDPLERDDLWIEAPKNLAKMGLSPFKEAAERGEILYRKLRKAAYGLNVAPRAWYLRLESVLQKLGYVKSQVDPGVFVKEEMNEVKSEILCYVDDMLISGTIPVLKEIEEELNKELTVGTAEYSWQTSGFSFTGKDIELTRNSKKELISIRVHQTAYIKDAIKMEDCYFPDDLKGRNASDLCSAWERDWYMKALGKLAWVVNTRPDLAIEHSECARFAKAPTIASAKRLQGVMVTLKDEDTLGVVLNKLDCEKLCVVCHADGSFGNAEKGKTQGGHLVWLANSSSKGVQDTQVGSLVNWLSSSLKRVCTSTFDAETLSTLRGSDEALCVAYLVSELLYGRYPSIAERVLTHGFGHRDVILKPKVPVYLFNDGDGTVKAVNTSAIKQANKRRILDIASLRELVDEELATLEHVDTHSMMADGLTKSAPLRLREPLREAMKGVVRLPGVTPS